MNKSGTTKSVYTKFSTGPVVETLNRLVTQRGKPKFLFADNGAEFTGHLMDMWA